MTHPSLPGLSHTGMVVSDLAVAMADFSEAFGLHWAEPTVAASDIVIPGGTAFRKSRITYSLEGPHHVELIEMVDATAWAAATGGPAVHHLGYRVDDLPAQSARLEGIGFRREFTGIGDGEDVHGFAYHYNHHGGLWIELVSAEWSEVIDRWIAGGEVPSRHLFKQ
jgi:hypothetical protein